MNCSHKISTLALYLPQFHAVEENSRWWGKGYTEWTAVKGARPLFAGHRQPRIPLDQNYYNLLSKNTLEWQSDLMKKYGVDGLCFYHYYFKDGRKILEKPAENLLQWKKIDMPFCFAWANGSWSRSWCNISGYGWTWDELKDKSDRSNGSSILLDQKYGRETAWKEHFEYLLPFFKDPRYIKRNGCPIFLFYLSCDIASLHAMCDYWRKLARESGFPNLYLIGMNTSFYGTHGLDAELYHSPHRFWDLNNAGKENGVRRPSFDKIWENLLQYRPLDGRKTYLGGFGDYDDTPRRGNISGIAVKGYSVDKLEKYMEELYLKSLAAGNEFVFYNAWNEWGEGMYLEPDEEEGFARLEALKTAKERILKRVNEEGAATFTKYLSSPGAEQAATPNPLEYEGVLARARCLDGILGCIEEGKDISALLKKEQVHSVAIYGMGVVGRHLAVELEKQGCSISYIIDKRSSSKYNYKFYSPNDTLPAVDAVIVTPIAEFDSIYDFLAGKMSTKIISTLELTREAE